MNPLVALTIGNFDGVHRGHQALIQALLDWKRQQAPAPVRTLVVTFEPHPAEVLRNLIIPRLTTPQERVHLIQKLGIDEVRILPFTTEFSQTSAQIFFQHLVLKELQTSYLVIGHDFYFGHNREGTPGRLLDWCQEHNIPSHLVDPIEADGAPISSSLIRKMISEGEMIAASRLLGRDYSLTLEVVHGDKRGRLLGFPTANMLPQMEGIGTRCIPAHGVYLSSSTVEGKTFASVTNVGVKPTVTNAGRLVVETHLLDFHGDLYGKQLTVEFRDRLRGERKFPGLEALTQQIQTDIGIARARLLKK